MPPDPHRVGMFLCKQSNIDAALRPRSKVLDIASQLFKGSLLVLQVVGHWAQITLDQLFLWD